LDDAGEQNKQRRNLGTHLQNNFSAKPFSVAESEDKGGRKKKRQTKEDKTMIGAKGLKKGGSLEDFEN